MTTRGGLVVHNPRIDEEESQNGPNKYVERIRFFVRIMQKIKVAVEFVNIVEMLPILMKRVYRCWWRSLMRSSKKVSETFLRLLVLILITVHQPANHLLLGSTRRQSAFFTFGFQYCIG